MLKKINLSKIVINHFKTLVSDNSKKPTWDDYLTFAIIPMLISGTLVYFNVFLTDPTINILITTLSILVGLLFNVIVLIFDIVNRNSKEKVKNVILEQLLANICFTILLSLVIILLTLITYIDKIFIKEISTAIVYFLLSNFFLTVLMILKRMYLLFNNELREIQEKEETK